MYNLNILLIFLLTDHEIELIATQAFLFEPPLMPPIYHTSMHTCITQS